MFRFPFEPVGSYWIFVIESQKKNISNPHSPLRGILKTNVP